MNQLHESALGSVRFWLIAETNGVAVSSGLMVQLNELAAG
jgi:hypothetical protein